MWPLKRGHAAAANSGFQRFEFGLRPTPFYRRGLASTLDLGLAEFEVAWRMLKHIESGLLAPTRDA